MRSQSHPYVLWNCQNGGVRFAFIFIELTERCDAWPWMTVGTLVSVAVCLTTKLFIVVNNINPPFDVEICYYMVPFGLHFRSLNSRNDVTLPLNEQMVPTFVL